MSPDTKNTPFAAALADPAANLQTVIDLCRELYAGGGSETARRLALEAGQLEAFFTTIRSSAEEVFKSTQALAILHTMVPPRQLAGATGHEESLLPRSLAARIAAEESARLIELGLNKPIAPETESGPDENPNEFDLDRFFANVSRSVIDAQRQLDVASMQYSRELANSPVPPAFYSIPTVHAEIKAGLSSVDGNGILVKLISDQSQSTFTESTISFDIVSSSPPPGALGKFTSPIPRFLVVDGPDWQRVMDALAAAQPPLAQGWQQRTVILRDLDPQLATLRQSVIVAFVPGPVPAPPQGSPPDYSQVPLFAFRFTEADGVKPVPPAQLTPEIVRAFSSMASWLLSITVR